MRITSPNQVLTHAARAAARGAREGPWSGQADYRAARPFSTTCVSLSLSTFLFCFNNKAWGPQARVPRQVVAVMPDPLDGRCAFRISSAPPRLKMPERIERAG